MATFEKHVFICTNERPCDDARGSCGPRGGFDVAAEFKRVLHERGLKRVVRANKAGCLDQCARGVSVVVYPEGVWYGGVTVGDVARIVDEHIIGERPVQALVLQPHELTGRDIDVRAAAREKSRAEAAPGAAQEPIEKERS